jgi:hypothetical protein
MVIAMVEVNASRGGRTLHNHAAHCLFVRDGLVAEWWMVEALPPEARPSGPRSGASALAVRLRRA